MPRAVLAKILATAAALLIAASWVEPTLAQSRSTIFEQLRNYDPENPNRERDYRFRNNDRIVIPPDQTQLIYHRAEDLPKQLRAVLQRDCRSLDALKAIPVRIFLSQVNRGPMVVTAPCMGIWDHGAAYIIGRWWEPEPIAFVTMDLPRGLTVTRRPGHLTWSSDTRLLTATRSSDIIPSPSIRHIYRYIGGEPPHGSPFALIGIEHCPQDCWKPEAQWNLHWEVPNLPPVR